MEDFYDEPIYTQSTSTSYLNSSLDIIAYISYKIVEYRCFQKVLRLIPYLQNKSTNFL